jgi:cephalosporin hydroxylase
MTEVLQVASELEAMRALYRERKPERVLEIGVWEGGTLRVWLEDAVPGATVVAVDLEHRCRDRYEGWQAPETTIEVVTGSSRDFAVMARIRACAPYGWVFIDGDHSAKGVGSDVRTCLPLIERGGLLLLHDITPPAFMDSYPPGELLRELARAGYEISTIVDPEPLQTAHGIGVVQL